MAIPKKAREQIYNKYGGRCAYCGCDLEKGWHVDHIEPRWHTWSEEDLNRLVKTTKGKSFVENYNPACPRCNKWKSTYGIEGFREEIAKQVIRLRKYNSNFRMAEDYGLAKETGKPVVFYFETQDKQSKQYL